MNKIRLTVPVLCLVIGLTAIESLAVPISPSLLDSATDTFTKIKTTGQLGGDFPFFSEAELDAPMTAIHHANTNAMYSSPGSLDGEGTADFGILKSKVRLQGPAALVGNSTSAFNDHWTVTSVSVPNGTLGTMQLSFNLSGFATVLDTFGAPVASNAFSSVALYVALNPTKYGGETALLSSSIDLEPGTIIDIQGTQGSPTVTIPFNFIYGSEFGIQASLWTSASTDNGYLYETSNPYFEYYGGGTIDDVTVDFTNTAELAAIVIPGDPDALVTTTSLADFSAVVTTQLPTASIVGDLNGDGFVGIEDLNLVLGDWNASPPTDPAADPTGDNFVGIEDLNVVLGNWNAGTPPPGEASVTVPEPGTLVVLTIGAISLMRRQGSVA